MSLHEVGEDLFPPGGGYDGINVMPYSYQWKWQQCPGTCSIAQRCGARCGITPAELILCLSGDHERLNCPLAFSSLSSNCYFILCKGMVPFQPDSFYKDLWYWEGFYFRLPESTVLYVKEPLLDFFFLLIFWLNKPVNFSAFIKHLIRQAFMEHLLLARHCARSWNPSQLILSSQDAAKIKIIWIEDSVFKTWRHSTRHASKSLFDLSSEKEKKN